MPESVDRRRDSLDSGAVGAGGKAPGRTASVIYRLKGYEPLCQLAVGGMAQVHLARTVLPPRRLVVVKYLPRAHRENRERLTLFIDEMRLARMLRHENIVELIDADVVDMQPYLVLEHIDGPSLRDLAVRTRERRSPLEPRFAVSIAAGVAAGLHYAHELKTEWGAPLELVHRDISPQNVMLTRAGCVKVLDFGVARAAGQRHETSERGIKGKIAYTPPEYIMGTKPDRRGDVFALGVVLWEMLTNERLFFRPTAPATMHAVLGEPILPPSALSREVSADLDAAVMTALERDPEGRWHTARAFAEALERAAAEEGGTMSAEEMAGLLRREFPDTVDPHRALAPEMSPSEVSAIVASSSTLEADEPARGRIAESTDSFEVEVDPEALDLDGTTLVDVEPPSMDDSD